MRMEGKIMIVQNKNTEVQDKRHTTYRSLYSPAAFKTSMTSPVSTTSSCEVR